MTAAPEAIAQALRSRGVETQAEQAQAVSERREHWNRYVNGHAAPNLAKLQRWLQSADEAGHTFHLTYDPHIGWKCKEAT